LWPDDAARRELDRWALALHRHCGGRRMRPENLHITLAFLGEVDASRVEEIAAAARSATPRRFAMLMDQPGYWKHNRIAWLGASRTPADLEAMVAELRAALERAGIAFDPKPFVAHVTMVRNARPPKEEWPTVHPFDWHVDGFALVASERDEGGTRYRVAAGPFKAAVS